MWISRKSLYQKGFKSTTKIVHSILIQIDAVGTSNFLVLYLKDFKFAAKFLNWNFKSTFQTVQSHQGFFYLDANL